MSSSAGCPNPQSTLSVTSAAPSDPLRVTGRYFAAACYDTNNDPPGPAPAQVKVPLVFEQAGTQLTVGRADVRGERYDVELDVTVPKTATPGPAQWRLGSSLVMPFIIVAPR